MKTHLTPIGALLIYVILLATYSFCIWQVVIVAWDVIVLYISSQIEKKIDKNVKKQNKND